MSGFDTETPEAADPGNKIVQPTGENHSGLRPLKRLTSDSRLDRIHGETLAKTELHYYSTFAREFCRSDYNFCAAKMTIARGGKLVALDAEFRVAEAFFKKALTWANQLHGRSTAITSESVTLEIKHPLSGRLVRLLTMYDQLFVKTLDALFTRSVMEHQRKAALESAEARLKQFPFLCIPDNDRYAPEGVLLPNPNATH